MNQYPMVHLLVRHGRRMADAAALAMPIGALILVGYGWSWSVLIVGMLFGVVVFVVARSFVEIVEIIADTLLPR